VKADKDVDVDVNVDGYLVVIVVGKVTSNSCTCDCEMLLSLMLSPTPTVTSSYCSFSLFLPSPLSHPVAFRFPLFALLNCQASVAPNQIETIAADPTCN